MFEKLGHFIVQRWQRIIAAWLIGLIALFFVAPNWEDVVQDGEFAFLPRDAPSRAAEETFKEAFPDEALTSQVFIVVRRTSNPTGLNEDDRTFVKYVIVPRLKRVLDYREDDEDEPTETDNERIVDRIGWFGTKHIGMLFESFDNKSSLIKIDLRSEFLSTRNEASIAKVEQLLRDVRYETHVVENDDGEEQEFSGIPAGLDLAISGNATFGRDMLKAQVDSGKATEHWTRFLVIVLLLLIYRAPVLALIPLITVSLATEITRKLLAIMAAAGWVDLFSGINPYVTVVVYGAGVDYCLFLIARYKEELDNGGTMNEAIVRSMSKIGAALTASAATVMCGIGMMVFAEFGKFQQAGVAITFGLFIVLLAALTFTPAVLRLCGKWAFWPNSTTENIGGQSGWVARSSLLNSIRDSNLLGAGWAKISTALVARPGAIWLTATLAMLPFAIIGVLFFGDLSYGLLTELPDTAPSVYGTRAVQNHFPKGEVDRLKILIRKPGLRFEKRSESQKLVGELTQNLYARREELGIAKIRSWTEPTGLPPHPREKVPEKGGAKMLYNAGRERHGYELFVSQTDPTITRIDVVPKDDPFTQDSITKFHKLQREFETALPPGLEGAEISYLGGMPSTADLKAVTDRDQVRIDVLVLVGVYLILVILLRRPMISLYLIISVFFSYLATLGLTFAFFWALDPSEFAGLDWKVPIFLFTILIAVGEDYNIFLITRIDEESEKYGPIKGITVALEKTGSIISSCGIIMAGTFSSLLAGSLLGMHQLGFALAAGVLLDTFVVRPILVPAYLIMLHSGRLGQFGKFLGARPPASTPTPAVAE